MSIEHGLKKIAEQLERIATAIESSKAHASVTIAAPAAVPDPVADIVSIQTPSEAAREPTDLPPLTRGEIEGFNRYLTEVAAYLGSTGPAQIRDVLSSHGLNGLYEIGEDRVLLQRVQADVQKLTAGVTA